jgi:hypothetical protein
MYRTYFGPPLPINRTYFKPLDRAPFTSARSTPPCYRLTGHTFDPFGPTFDPSDYRLTGHTFDPFDYRLTGHTSAFKVAGKPGLDYRLTGHTSGPGRPRFEHPSTTINGTYFAV